MFANVFASETGNKPLFNENMPLAQAQMSSATVFLFLLDNLPDFKYALNSTLVTLYQTEDIALDISYVDNCNPIIAQSVLNEIKIDIEQGNLSGQDSTEESTPMYLNDYKEAYNELSPETLYDIETVLDNTVKDNNYNNYMETDNTFNDITLHTTPEYDESPKNKVFTDKINASDANRNVRTMSKDKFPEKATILVAMFETLLNVTAQTCGGTLVSRHWVLTAASCLGWLSNLYVDSINKKKSGKSEYTFIIGATNPFKDGFVHHVTEIVYVPDEIDTLKSSNVSYLKTWNSTNQLNKQDRNLSVVLLRIEPAASVETLPIFTSKLKEIEDVQVYGWSLVNNETGSEVMNVASFSAKTSPPEECKANLTYPDQDSILCLTLQNDIDSKINQMYYGGPVLVQQGDTVRLLAVAQSEGAARGAALFAYSLPTHAAWIEAVVGNK